MKKLLCILMLAAFMLPFASQAQTSCGTLNLPFSESFDSTSTTRNCWTTIDADADGNGWTTFFNNVDQGMMLSFSYDNSYGALTPNNWLISPKLHTVAGNDLTLQWTVAAGDNTYNAEHYGVYVSTTTTDTSAFTLLNQWTLSDDNSHEMILDLSAYAGQDIYIAFRHFNCTDQYVLIIDDVEVYEGAYVPDTLNVTFAVNDATLGTTNPAPGTYQYITGDTVTFSAIPTGSNVFTGWEMIAGADTTMLGTGYIEASFLASNMMSYGNLTFTANFLSCDAVDLPFTETFDDTSATRYCWNLVSNNTSNVGGSNGMGFVTVDGREVLRFSSYSSATDYNQYALSPLMNVSSDATNLQVSVVYGTRADDYLYFGYITANNDTVWDPTAYNTASTSTTYNWDTYTAVIPATAVQLIAHYYGNYAYYAWIDTLNVIELTGDYCYPVANLTLDTATASSVTLSWDDANNTGATYSIYGADGTVVADGISGTSYTINDLSPMTAYTFGVAANCSATSSSTIAIIDVATACAGETCNITIVGADSFGDGWNGNAIDVMQAGFSIGTFTISTGDSNTELYSVCSAVPVSFRWISGSYPGETSFQIFDGGMVPVYDASGSDMVNDSVFFTLNSACPSCIPVTVTVDSVTQTSVTISWTGSAASYDLYMGELFVTSTTANTYTFTGLAAANTYNFGVQAICAVDDTANMTSISVMTSCGTVTTLPYLESFEYGLGCWNTVSAPASDVSWNVLRTASAHSGNSAAYSYSYGSYSALNANTWLISPKFELPATTDTITFSWWELVSQSYPDSYSVAISTTTADTSAFTVIRPLQQGNGEWTQRYVDLSAYAGQSVYLAFHHVDYDMNYLLIDDVEMYLGAYVGPQPDMLMVTLDVNDSLRGSITPAPGTYYLGEYDSITVTATPAAGNNFLGWAYSYTYDGTTNYDTVYDTDINPYTVYGDYWMEVSPISFTALFGVPDTLTVTLAVNDATMGTTNPVPGTYTYVTGESPMFEAIANSGYEFVEWQVLVDGELLTTEYNPVSISAGDWTEYGSMVFTAVFDEVYVPEPDTLTVTFAVNNAAMGTINPAPGTYTYYTGDTVAFSATPTAGNHFVAWLISAYGETDTLTDYIAAYASVDFFTDYFGNVVTLTAVFEAGNPDSTTITYAVNDPAMGTLNPAPGTYTIYVGDEIEAHAFANSGYHLEAWVFDIYLEGMLYSSDTIYSDDEDFSNPMLFGTLPQSFPDYGATITVTALFDEGGSSEPDYVTVTFNVNDPSMGTINPSGIQTFEVGDVLTITATPFEGYRIVSWTVTLSDGTSSTLTEDVPNTYTDTVEAFLDGAVITVTFGSLDGIDDVAAAQWSVASVDGKIVVRGVENMDVNVFDVTGRQIQAIKPSSNQATIDVPAAGVYMVKAGNAVKRVVVLR